MWKFLRKSVTLMVALGVMHGAAPAMASDWPNKPLTLVVPFGPGSSPDIMSRMIAEEASQTLGQPIIIQNRAGASGNLGTNVIAKAAPDGYTFGVSITGPMVNNTVLYSELPYDPKTDLVPLTLAVHQYNVLVVRDDSPITSFDDFLEALTDQNNDFNFPSTGAGTVSHLAVELLLERTNGNAVHIPYASSPAAVTSVLAGDTDFAALPPVAVMPLVKDGRLRPIAAVAADRLSFLPDLPTIAESGVPGVEGSGWLGFVAPAGIPDDIQTQLVTALVDALHNPSVKGRLQNQFMESVGSTPEEFGQYMDEELERWAPLIKRLDLPVN